jgi:hypothetical protein
VTPRETKGARGAFGRDLIVGAIALLTLVSALWLGAVSWNDSTSRQSASWVSGPDAVGPDEPAATTAGSDTAVLSSAP